MKTIDFDAHVSQASQTEAVLAVLHVVREARIKIYSDLHPAKLQQIKYESNQARLAALKEAGVDVPANVDLQDREVRLNFFSRIPLDKQIMVYQKVSDAIEAVAQRENIPALLQLERVRKLQTKGALKIKTKEDTNALMQVTLGVITNTLEQHASRRLSTSTTLPLSEVTRLAGPETQ